MYMRLAFAVAAHLEPEILVVDEVLAVGDTEFQKKCFAKIRQIGGLGRTILLVSHDLRVVKALSQTSILLDSGNMLSKGEPNFVISSYLESDVENINIRTKTQKLTWSGLVNRGSLKLSRTSDLLLDLMFQTGDVSLKNVYFDVALYNSESVPVIHAKSKFVSVGMALPSNSTAIVSFNFQKPNLAPGRYTLEVYAYDDDEVLLWVDQISCCDVSHDSGFRHQVVLDRLFG